MTRSLRPVALVLLAVSLLTILAPLPGRAQEATPAVDCPATTPEQNEAIALAYWQAWNDRGDFAAVLAPDEVHHWGIGDDTTGIDAFREVTDRFLAAFPDITFTVDHVAAQGDRVGTRWTATGTQEGEWQGIAPTNRQVSWGGNHIFRIACGKIAETWDEADHLSLRQQLGGIDLPESMGAAAEETGTAPAATPCADDTPERNAEIASSWSNNVMSNADMNMLAEILDPAVVYHGSVFPTMHGPEEVEAAVARQLTAFPDLAQSVEETVAAGDLVFVRWSATATQKGEWLGLAPTGRPVNITGLTLYRIECGKIVDGWVEFNAWEVYQGLAASGEATPAA